MGAPGFFSKRGSNNSLTIFCVGFAFFGVLGADSPVDVHCIYAKSPCEHTAWQLFTCSVRVRLMQTTREQCPPSHGPTEHSHKQKGTPFSSRTAEHSAEMLYQRFWPMPCIRETFPSSQPLPALAKPRTHGKMTGGQSAYQRAH